MSTDNFAWTVNDEKGNLLAYQERGTESKVVLIDEQKAIERCQALTLAAMNDTSLDYTETMKAVGTSIYCLCKILGKMDRPKSTLILPGQY